MNRSMAIPGAAEWFIAQQRWPNDVMFHYTSREALENIVTTRRMWATDLRAMNDPREILHGKEMIDQRIKRASRRRHPVIAKFLQMVRDQFHSIILNPSRSFAISLSAHPDLPHQWRDYARDGTGFALGWCIDSPCPEIPLRMWVTYDQLRQRSLVDGILDFHLNWIRKSVDEGAVEIPEAFGRAGLSMAIFLDIFLHTFKGRKWEPEGEFRYVYQVFHGYERPNQVIMNRTFNGIQKSYIEADFAQVELRHVIIGPRNDVTATEQWLRDVLDGHGFRETAIVRPLVSVGDLTP